MLLVAAFLAFAQDPAQPSLPDLLSRVAEEAEILQQNAPKSLTQETLEQRALMPATRFRPRIGEGRHHRCRPPAWWSARSSPSTALAPSRTSAVPNLTELRQVISVDGRKVQSRRTRPPRPLPRHHFPRRPGPQAHARGLRQTRTRGYRHRLRHLPPRFQQTRPGEHELRLRRRRSRSAPTPPGCSTGEQTSPDGGMLEFLGNQASRRALQGRLLVRKSDGLPLRIQVVDQAASILNRSSAIMIRDDGHARRATSTTSAPPTDSSHPRPSSTATWSTAR